MALNDAQHEARRNLVVSRVSPGVSEGSVDLDTIAKSGAPPYRVVVRNVSLTIAEVGFVTTGPYVEIPADGEVELGAVMPGDDTVLYHVGSGSDLSIMVWS
jgi:hypothetical protein